MQRSHDMIGRYQSAEMEINLLFGSTLRTKILIALFDGRKGLGELEEMIGSRVQNISAKVKELEKGGIIKREKRGTYSLSHFGRRVCSKIVETVEFINNFKTKKEFWSTHRIDLVPKQFLEELMGLPNLKIVGDGVNPFEVESIVSGLINNAENRVLGISPVGTSMWGERVIEAAERGIKVSIIIDDALLETMGEGECGECPLLNHPNIRIMLNNDIKLGFASNGKAIVLSFFDQGGLDLRKVLIGEGIGAVRWGEALFAYYEERSNVVRKIDPKGLVEGKVET